MTNDEARSIAHQLSIIRLQLQAALEQVGGLMMRIRLDTGETGAQANAPEAGRERKPPTVDNYSAFGRNDGTAQG